MPLFQNLNSEELETLKSHIKSDTPFGPGDAALITQKSSNRVLFNKENELCRQYRRSPSIIVGRKGSGKTSIISNTEYLGAYKYILKVEINEILSSVFDDLSRLDEKTPVYVEDVAKLWRFLFDVNLISHIVSRESRKDFLIKCKRFLIDEGITSGSSLLKIVKIIKNKKDKIEGEISGIRGILFSTAIEYIAGGRDSYVEAINELELYLKTNKFKSIILIDSVENYHTDFKIVQISIAGLLKCVSLYESQNRELCICFPGEQIHEIKNCSENPAKDFAKNLLLHWSPTELYSLVAWRYYIFCLLYDKRIPTDIIGTDFADRKQIFHVLSKFLQEYVVNGLQIKEPTMSYILRHTQLLPRQVLLILNNIFKESEEFRCFSEIKEDQHIVDAISESEYTLKDEIFAAYKFKYPYAESYARVIIPELTRVFKDGEFEKTYKRMLGALAEEDGVEGVLSLTKVKRMFIEIGIIGRVTGENPPYVEAEFEYAQPGKMAVSVEDKLCIHPIFSGAFKSSKNSGNGLMVYPHKRLFDNESMRNLRIV